MAVLRGSRYEGVEFTGIRGTDGVVRRFLHQREPLSEADVQDDDVVIHELEHRQELDFLAFQFAKKPLIWWVIADVNGILFPLTETLDGTRGVTPEELKPGQTLVIPLRLMRERKES